MGRRVLVWVIAGLLASITACSGGEAADTAIPTTIVAGTTTEVAPTTVPNQPLIVTENGLEYASWGDWTLTLDMHVPPKSAGAPIIVYLPGVIWSPLPLPAETAEGLVEAGAILFVVRYAAEATLDNGAILDGHGVRARAMADSVACAIHFARARASELGSDDPVVVLTGFSLGGGVAAHVAIFGTTLETRWDQYATEGGPASDVNCQVTDGSTDVDALVGIAGEYDVSCRPSKGRMGVRTSRSTIRNCGASCPTRSV